MFYVEKIEIKNFAGIRQKEYSFVDDAGKPAQIVAFIGPNGSGKTSVMQALEEGIFELIAKKNMDINNRHVIEDYKVNIHTGGRASIGMTVHAGSDEEAKNYRWTVLSNSSGNIIDPSEFDLISLVEEMFPGNRHGRLPLLMSYAQNRFVSGYESMAADRETLIPTNISAVTGIEFFEDIYDFPDVMQWLYDTFDIISQIESVDEFLVEDLISSLSTTGLSSYEEANELMSVKFIVDLTIVVKSIIPSFDGMLVDPVQEELLVVKDDKQCLLRHLAFSEQMVILLIADLLYRDLFTKIIDNSPLTELNGAILIDSVDYKLEPAVLTKLLQALKKYLPNRQFFLSADSDEAFENIKDILIHRL